MPVSPEVHEAALQAATAAMRSYLRSERKWHRPLVHLHDGIEEPEEHEYFRSGPDSVPENAWNALTAHEREVLELRYLEKLTVRETAERISALDRAVPVESLTTDDTRAEADWEAREAFTVDYHPIRRIRPSRAGRFSALVVRAAQESIISFDTAEEWLEADSQDIKRAIVQLPVLYPSESMKR